MIISNDSFRWISNVKSLLQNCVHKNRKSHINSSILLRIIRSQCAYSWMLFHVCISERINQKIHTEFVFEWLFFPIWLKYINLRKHNPFSGSALMNLCAYRKLVIKELWFGRNSCSQMNALRKRMLHIVHDRFGIRAQFSLIKCYLVFELERLISPSVLGVYPFDAYRVVFCCGWPLYGVSACIQTLANFHTGAYRTMVHCKWGIWRSSSRCIVRYIKITHTHCWLLHLFLRIS